MDLASPTSILAAWLLYPIVAVLISAGTGVLLSRAVGRPLGLSALPLGFLATLVVFAFLLSLGLPADLVSLLIGAAAAIGLVLRWRSPIAAERPLAELLRRPGGEVLWFVVSGVAVYLIGMLPLIATGEIGVLGYYFLNDAAWHTALIEWLHAHGAHSSAVVDSSWTAVSQQVAQGYPLGTYVWPLIGITFTGSSAFALWTPSCALTLAMLALLVQRIARRSGAKSGWSAALAVPIAAGYLPLSFLAQGGLKELLFAFALLAAAWSIADIEITEGSGLGTQIRALLGGAIGLAALITIFGPGGAAWILPMAFFACLIAFLRPPTALRRPRVIVLAGALGVLTLLLALPSVLAALRGLGTVSVVAQNTTNIGNLLGPVPLREVLGGWVSSDYREAAPSTPFHGWSYLLSAAAGLLLVIGGLRELFSGRIAVPLAGFAGGVALVYVGLRFNVYFQAKTYVALAPAVGCAIASALIWLIAGHAPRRRSGRIIGVVLAAMLLGSFVANGPLLYAHVWTSPTARLQEMAAINQRIAGAGPTLFYDQDDYGQSMLRAGRATQPFGLFHPPVTIDVGPSRAIPPDLDDVDEDDLQHYKVLVERRKPVGTRPPGNYSIWFETDFYTVWRRTAPPPLLHLPIGLATPSGMAPLDCSSPQVRKALELAHRKDRSVRLALASRQVAEVPAGQIVRRAPWALNEPDSDGYLVRAGKQDGSFNVRLEPGVRYEAWVQGAFGPGIAVQVDGRRLGAVSRGLGWQHQWWPLGTFTAGDQTTVKLTPAGDSLLHPGSKLYDFIRGFAFTRAHARARVVSTTADGARAWCGRPVDWIEVAR
jgi:hypothetical protein